MEAQTFKEEGNSQYKLGNFKSAISFYQQASDLEPRIPVYLSNLSAAQFEDGQYTEALNVCNRALSLLTDPQDALRSKLSARREKILVFLQNDQSQVEVNDVQRRQALQRLSTRDHDQENLFRKRVASLPRYRQRPASAFEYYVVGHDPVTSIFRGQSEDFVKSADPLRIRPVPGSPFHFSALFCGIGDARHLYGSFIDIGQALQSPLGGDSSVHFTLIDIHPTALARDLIVLFTLKELASVPSDLSQRRKELLAMLHYLFWATVMPPFAAELMDTMLAFIHSEVQASITRDSSLDLGWLYIDCNSCKQIHESLEWWLTKGKTEITFNEALAQVDNIKLNNILTGEDLKAAKVRTYYTPLVPHTHVGKSKQASSKKEFVRFMKDPTNKSVVSEMAAKQGLSAQELIKSWEEMDDEEYNWITETQHTVPMTALAERRAYPVLRVLVPPPGCGEPKELEDHVFEPLRKPDQRGVQTQILKRFLDKFIRNRWVPNYTLLDRRWIENRNRGEEEPFQGCKRLFEPYFPKLTTDKPCLYNISGRFFDLAAQGIAQMQKALKIEIIVGDGFAAMDAVHLGTIARQPEFPNTFDRIHASNVPDYIGGHLAIFTSGFPLLKEHDHAYFTANNLLNCTFWEGGMFNDKLFGVTLSSQIFTYTGATLEEVSSAYGVQIHGRIESPNYYSVYQKVRPGTSLLSRDAFLRVATGCFLRTVLPAPYVDITKNPNFNVREVVNVHSFFRALEWWKGLGYPAHVLSDLVDRILENRLERCAQPHRKAPVPLEEHRKAMIPVCTLPFLADVEVAAAIWEPLLFPILSPKLPAVGDIRRFSVKLRLVHQTALMRVPSTHMSLILVFGLPRDMDATSMDIRESIAGSITRFNYSLQFISTFTFDPDTSLCTFLLTKQRADAFRKDGYEVGLASITKWKLQSHKVACNDLSEVGDVDSWNVTKEVASPTHIRRMTTAQEDAWMHEVLGPLGSGGGGAPDCPTQ